MTHTDKLLSNSLAQNTTAIGIVRVTFSKNLMNCPQIQVDNIMEIKLQHCTCLKQEQTVEVTIIIFIIIVTITVLFMIGLCAYHNHDCNYNRSILNNIVTTAQHASLDANVQCDCFVRPL